MERSSSRVEESRSGGARLSGDGSAPPQLSEEEIKLNRKVAECVKRRLNKYYCDLETTRPEDMKIATPEAYTHFAKQFSHQMREKIKESYMEFNRTLDGLSITADNKSQIEMTID